MKRREFAGRLMRKQQQTGSLSVSRGVTCHIHLNRVVSAPALAGK